MKRQFWITWYAEVDHYVQEVYLGNFTSSHTMWRRLSLANPYVLVLGALVVASSELAAKDLVVAHFGAKILWRSCEEVPSTWTPPKEL